MISRVLLDAATTGAGGVNWWAALLTAVISTVAASIGAYLSTGYSRASRLQEKRRDESESAAIDLLKSAHTSAHLLGRLVVHPDTPEPQERQVMYWTLDSETTPALRAYEALGQTVEGITKARVMVGRLRAFRAAVLKDDQSPIGDYNDETYSAALADYQVARLAFINQVRTDRGLAKLATKEDEGKPAARRGSPRA